MAQARAAGAELMININGSPFHLDKYQSRLDALHARQQEAALPIIYVNLVGGQDELVFDGCSMAVDCDGSIRVLAPACEASLTSVHIKHNGEVATIAEGDITPVAAKEALVLQGAGTWLA